MPTLKDLVPEGTVARNKKTGERMTFRNGRWNVGGPEQANPTKTTEDSAKNRQLYERASEQLPILNKNWEGLTDWRNQAGRNFANAGAFGYDLNPIPETWTTGPEYQQADNALKDLASTYLYSVSGATATKDEIDRLIGTIRPVMGEAKTSADQKRARIQQMVQSIRQRAYPGGTTAPETGTGPQQQPPQTPRVRVYNPATGRLE